MPPEYAIHGQLSEKVDTYSFGVVVLEIISGRKSSEVKNDTDGEYLLERVISVINMICYSQILITKEGNNIYPLLLQNTSSYKLLGSSISSFEVEILCWHYVAYIDKIQLGIYTYPIIQSGMKSTKVNFTCHLCFNNKKY